MKVIKQAIFSFMQKWYKNRNFNIQVIQYLPMYYEGDLITKLPPGKRPTDIEIAFAELDLAMGYIDWSEITPIKRDFLKLYKLMGRYVRGTACTYHHIAGDNKVFESGSEANIMMYAVDEASVYFM